MSDMENRYKEAKALFASGQWGKIVPLLQALADEGYPEAQYQLGICYFRGEGVQQDHAKAIEWWTKAAKQDSRKQGVVAAVNTLYDCYENGIGVEKDSDKAHYWWVQLPTISLDPPPPDNVPGHVIEAYMSSGQYQGSFRTDYGDRKPRER